MHAMFAFCDSLINLNISNFKYDSIDTSDYMNSSSMISSNGDTKLVSLNLPKADLPDSIVGIILNRNGLKYVKCENKNNITKIISHLPARTSADPGKIITKVPMSQFTELEIQALADKNWTISNEALQVVAKYRFAKDLYRSLIPAFNSGFTTNYFVDDEYLNTEDLTDMYGKDYNQGYTITAENIVTRTISVLEEEVLPTRITFGTSWFTNSTLVDERPKAISLLESIEINTNNLSSMAYMYRLCYNVKNISTEGWDTSKVVDMKCAFANCYNLLSIDVSNFDTSNVLNMYSMFYINRNLGGNLDVSNWDTRNVTNMEFMFQSCEKLTSLDVSNFDTSNVTRMDYMFYKCNNLTSLDVSNFDTSKVFDMQYMFNGCNNLTSLDVSGFDTSNVTNMNNMFCNCKSLTSLDVSNFDTSKVTTMSGMFFGCKLLTSLDVSNFDTGNVTNMSGMFYDCNQLTSLDVSNWNTSNVTNMYALFQFCTHLTSLDLSNFDTSKVTNIGIMFNSLRFIENIDLSNWDTSNVTSMWKSLCGCAVKNLNLNNIIISPLTDIDGILESVDRLEKIYINIPETVDRIVSHLPDRSLTTTGRIIMPNKDQVSAETVALLAGKNWHLGNLIASYKYDSNICEDLIPVFNDGFGTDKYVVVDTNDSHKIITRNIEDVDGTMPTMVRFGTNVSGGAVTDATSSLLELLDMNTQEITFMEDMFRSCVNLKAVNTKHWNTSKVTVIGSLFCKCEVLTTIDVSMFDTSNVVDMERVFGYCYDLETIIGLEKWDTSKVTNMYYLFYQCNKLRSVDLSNIDTRNIDNLAQTFAACHALTKLDLSNFDTSKVIIFNKTFNACRGLIELDLSNWNADNVNNSEYFINNCPELTTVTVNTLSMMNVVTNRLPDRTGKEAGTVVYYGIDEADIDTETLQAKNWNLSYEPILAKYIFDSNVYENFLPKFNGEYLSVNYKVIDDVKADGRVVRTLKYDNDKRPTWIRLGDYDSTNDELRKQALLDVLYVNIDSHILSCYYSFANCRVLKRINTRNWNTENVEDMYCMFHGCNSLISLDLNSFDTRNVTDMAHMFQSCQTLTTIDLSNFDTSNVIDMNHMFHNCHKLTSLDLSNWDTSNVTDMSNMFRSMVSITTLDISNFNMENIINCDSMILWNNANVINMSNCKTEDINTIIGQLRKHDDGIIRKLYILNNKEHDLIDKATLDTKNWKAVIYGGNIKAVHIPEGIFNSLGLGNVLLKHIHIGERFLED